MVMEEEMLHMQEALVWDSQHRYQEVAGGFSQEPKAKEAVGQQRRRSDMH
jgi:hypothetical protein